MAARDGEQRSGLTDAAGRTALFPARTAARVWRDQLEAAMDDVLSAPEITRVIDRAFAGSQPEEIARSVVRHRVLERVAAELAASGELERLLNAALASPRTLELTDRMLASEETQHALRQVASSPAILDALERQTSGLAEEVVGRIRAAAVHLDGRQEHVVSRLRRSILPAHARRGHLCAGARHGCARDDVPVHGDRRRRRRRGVSRWRLASGMARGHAPVARLDPARGLVLRSDLR